MHPKLNPSLIYYTIAQSKQKRKLWSTESMETAVESVKGGKGLREASRLYNVSVKSLRRRVTGVVERDCWPGPATELTKSEEDEIVDYLIQMAYMGYGLTREAVIHMVLKNVNESKPSFQKWKGWSMVVWWI